MSPVELLQACLQAPGLAHVNVQEVRASSLRAQAGGSYMVIPTAEDIRALSAADPRLPAAALAAGHANSMINVNIDMLLGSGAGAGAGRPEARMGDWAPDGLVPDASTADAFAGAGPQAGI